MENAYKQAGVDVEAGYEVVDRIKPHIRRTDRPGVMSQIGGFGGAFDLGAAGIEDPLLVSGTDGVGTKLLVAVEAGRYDTVGIDCVAMCVNDIVVQGAQPLFFLDYLATGKTDPAMMEKLVEGVAEGCVQAGAALLGGETAEMPGMYSEGHFDMAGFAVGAVSRADILTGEDVEAGDVLIGLPSSGFHSNGYSLIRKVVFDQAGLSVDSLFPGVTLPDGTQPTVADVLLTPTRIYASAVLPLVEAGLVRAAAHITGGGFVENLPRMLPDGLGAEIDLGSWPVPPEFTSLATLGNIPTEEMYGIFNMGIGMVLAVPAADVPAARALLDDLGEPNYLIGTVFGDEDGQRFRFLGSFDAQELEP